jgi:hypothetical protein
VNEQTIRTAAITCLVLGLGAVASVLSPTPATSELPDIALGSPLLLHVERCVAFVAIVGMAVIVVARGTRGHLPIRFAQVEYDSERTAGMAEIESRLRDLERAAGIRRKVENGDEPI